jgi:hypothetical protein
LTLAQQSCFNILNISTKEYRELKPGTNSLATDVQISMQNTGNMKKNQGNRTLPKFNNSTTVDSNHAKVDEIPDQ